MLDGWEPMRCWQPGLLVQMSALVAVAELVHGTELSERVVSVAEIKLVRAGAVHGGDEDCDAAGRDSDPLATLTHHRALAAKFDDVYRRVHVQYPLPLQATPGIERRTDPDDCRGRVRLYG